MSAQSKQSYITVILLIINPLTSAFYLRHIQPRPKIMRPSKFIFNILNFQKKPTKTQPFSSLKLQTRLRNTKQSLATLPAASFANTYKIFL